MARDIVYYFDKVKGSGIGLGGVQGHELGEIQTDFNMSFTIDGSKDSCKIKVLSYTNYELEPFTILWHYATQTWWIVKNDKVERHQNESGFYYIHNINLNGAIDLLSARDLTDCACNSKIYTIHQVASKLIALSNFEFSTTFYYQNNVNSNDIVDYVKTFENYSLLSALREFFDGYNCSLKMTFNTHYGAGVYYLDSANILVYSKSGNVNNTIIDIDTFDDTRETRTIGSNSFGTTVMSNAENVISTKAKTYPSVGAVRPSSKEYELTADASAGHNTNNAIIRLPTPAYTVNWVRIWTYAIGVTYIRTGDPRNYLCAFYPFNKSYTQELFDAKIDDLITAHPDEEQDLQELKNNFNTIFENVLKYCSVTLYNGVIYNADDTFTIPSSIPYMPSFSYTGGDGIGTTRKFGLFTKDIKNSLKRPWQGMSWERGSDIIDGLEMFSLQDGLSYDYLEYNDANSDSGDIYTQGDYLLSIKTMDGSTTRKFELTAYNLNGLFFSVNYIPMLDLKIKVENQTDKRDIHLYNQNGKFIDSVALSKLLNSYADEISSDNITRFMTYYSFSSVPKVGTIVDNNGTKYVINNVSVEFTQNEQNGSVAYFIQAEFTLSKQVAVKSININANSNIRDYGIPQANTVMRKQLYRDYYEFTLNYDTSSDTDWYISLQNELLLTNTKKQERQAIIQITWFNNNTYYYQLPTEIFPLKKQVVEVVNFKDNNIIGYSSQVVGTGFDLTRLLQYNNVTVPISYVNDWGGFKGIDLKMVKADNVEKAFNNYLTPSGYQTSAGLILNEPFIPQDIYTYVINNGLVDYSITENAYQKDPLEVPVFEHITQLNDSDEVIVGANIFDDHSEENNVGYIYAWGYAPKNKANEYNASSFVTQTITRTGTAPNYVWSIHHPCRLGYGTKNSHKVMSVELFEDWSSNNGFHNSMAVNNSYDLVVFRIAYNPYTNKVIAKDLMFVVNVGENAEYTPSQGIYLYINHYKVEK